MPEFVIEGDRVQKIRIVVEAKDRDEALEISERELLDMGFETLGQTEFRTHYIS